MLSELASALDNVIHGQLGGSPVNATPENPTGGSFWDAPVTETPRAGSVEDLFAHEENAAHTAEPAQIAVAQAALDVVTARFGRLPYARIDLVRLDGQRDPGGYAVLELELIEPSLFLPQADPAAAERLATALAAR